jgi:rubrerythrin
MTRSIEDLTPKEMLALAVHVERANAARFRAFAGVFAGYDPKVAARFQELAAEEQQHESLLTTWFGRRFPGPIPTVEEADVKGIIESVDMVDAESLIFNTLEPAEVYDLALRAERGARDFYKQAAATARDAELAALYQELADMEKDHQAWLEERMRKPEPR